MGFIKVKFMFRFVKERGDLEKEYARGLRKLVARWGKISEKIFGGEKISDNFQTIFGGKVEKDT